MLPQIKANRAHSTFKYHFKVKIIDKNFERLAGARLASGKDD